MKPDERLSRSVLFSIILHSVLALLLLYAAHQTVMTAPASVSVELWSAAPAQNMVSEPPPVVKPPAPEPAPAPEMLEPKADIQLGHKPKPELRKVEASRAEARPLLKIEAPKHEPNPPKRREPRPQTVLAEAHKTPSVQHHKANKRYTDDSTDLLAELAGTHAANAKRSQAGSTQGVPGGVPNGSVSARDHYAAKVRAVIYPLVNVPPSVQGNPTAVVQVTLLPGLQVRSVKLLKSSGNSAYDEAVQRAINEVGTFPSLPVGTVFSDVRQLRLEFRPH